MNKSSVLSVLYVTPTHAYFQIRLFGHFVILHILHPYANLIKKKMKKFQLSLNRVEKVENSWVGVRVGFRVRDTFDLFF